METMQLVVNVTFLHTYSLQPNKILSLARANTNVILAVVSSLRLKSTKLANKKWKLRRQFVCWQLFLEQWLKALNSRSDQHKKYFGCCWTWQMFSSDLASICSEMFTEIISKCFSCQKEIFILFDKKCLSPEVHYLKLKEKSVFFQLLWKLCKNIFLNKI